MSVQVDTINQHHSSLSSNMKITRITDFNLKENFNTSLRSFRTLRTVLLSHYLRRVH